MTTLPVAIGGVAWIAGDDNRRGIDRGRIDRGSVNRPWADVSVLRDSVLRRQGIGLNHRPTMGLGRIRGMVIVGSPGLRPQCASKNDGGCDRPAEQPRSLHDSNLPLDECDARQIIAGSPEESQSVCQISRIGGKGCWNGYYCRNRGVSQLFMPRNDIKVTST